MKIAFVYERATKIGGAERVLQVMHEIWPNAVLYTSFVNKTKAPWVNKFKIRTSFLQLVRFLPYEILPNLMSYVFKSFDFKNFDIVLSVSSGEGKYLSIQKPTRHICYCLTPTRYLWSGYFDYLKQPGFGKLNFIAKIWFIVVSPLMRMKDFEESQKIDKFIAISQEVKKRIWKYYRRESEVIYPPTGIGGRVGGVEGIGEGQEKGEYFLIVSRLVPYKQIDLAINVFNKMPDKNLVIVGTGLDEARLKKIKKNNIMFKGLISDKDLYECYGNCLALIFPGIEDFGLTSLEAQAFGKPVICRDAGGTKETVRTGKTGEIFESEKELSEIITEFDKDKYQKKDFEDNLLKFSKENFKRNFKNLVGEI